MYRNLTISVCLPCRNEAGHLAAIIESIPSFVDEVIVVSNASTDDSVEVARAAGATVRRDDRTRDGIGYGFAHMTAMATARGDLIVGIDADGTYPIEELGRVIDHMLEQRLDFVSCARLKRSRIPFKLRLGVWLLNAEVWLLYCKRIDDILSGMWVLTCVAREQLTLDQGDWNLSPQIKIEAMLSPVVSFAEYQITQKQRYGKTHQRYFKTGFSHARWLLKNQLRHPQPWLPLQEVAPVELSD